MTSDLGQAYGWKLPWAKDGIGVAIGYEYRSETLTQSVDAEFDTGDLNGQGGSVRLRLSPPDLGSLNIEIHVAKGEMTELRCGCEHVQCR